jgi:[NiFe] hydrogenase diaphorase moiety small subunit
VFQFTGRGAAKKISVNATSRLADTALKSADKAVDACPVGSILKKEVGFAVPIGERLYDHKPIGSEIESKSE